MANMIDDEITKDDEGKLSIIELYDIENVKRKLSFQVAVALCKLRSSELNEIIADFPFSYPALLDLRDSALKTDRFSSIQDTLSSIFDRLLHPGVTTATILQKFVDAVRASIVLDPTFKLYESITDMTRSYLRGRADSMRCIVEKLYSETLDVTTFNENAPPPLIVDPPPPNVPPTVVTWPVHASENVIPAPPPHTPTLLQPLLQDRFDLTQTLIDLSNSKESFVTELQSFLASRFLSPTQPNTSVDITVEMRRFDRLRAYFDDGKLGNCEVMIKDVYESAYYRQRAGMLGGRVAPTVLSRHYWPGLDDSNAVQHPPPPVRFHQYMRAFEGTYAELRRGRTLDWIMELGCVEVVVTTNSGLEVECSLTQLEFAVLCQFQERGRWTVPEMAACFREGLAGKVEEAMAMWVEKGVVVKQGGVAGALVYVSVDAADGHGAAFGDEDAIDDEMDVEDLDAGMIDVNNPVLGPGAPVSSTAAIDNVINPSFAYVLAMLTNLGPMGIDRIHQILGQFCEPYEDAGVTTHDLQGYLMRKIAGGEL
ncbi:Anaphase-promoting complex subunit 2, partial [Irineochytrium annulatum]